MKISLILTYGPHKEDGKQYFSAKVKVSFQSLKSIHVLKDPYLSDILLRCKDVEQFAALGQKDIGFFFSVLKRTIQTLQFSHGPFEPTMNFRLVPIFCGHQTLKSVHSVQNQNVTWKNAHLVTRLTSCSTLCSNPCNFQPETDLSRTQVC